MPTNWNWTLPQFVLVGQELLHCDLMATPRNRGNMNCYLDTGNWHKRKGEKNLTHSAWQHTHWPFPAWNLFASTLFVMMKHIYVRNCSSFFVVFLCLFMTPVCSEGAIWQRTGIGGRGPFWRFNLHVVRFRQMDSCPVHMFVCLLQVKNQTKQWSSTNLPASMPSLLVENWHPGKGQR